ncbi:MAG: tail fiber domain-containing protein [Chloroflexota bacterium]|nr:MAG: tail fiber domain-containing protein [Chloroflexota bacterium]
MPIVLEDVKGAAQMVCSGRTQTGIVDTPVDCSRSNAVMVQVFVTGTGASADFRLLGASESGANYLPLPDLNAAQSGVTANKSFDVIVGSRWLKLEFTAVSGTFDRGQGYTVFITPYVSPGSARVSASIVVDSLAAISANLGSVTAGQIVVGDSSNKLWLNDAGDGGLAIGGTVKADAPFRVSSNGVLVALAAIIGGAIVTGAGSDINGSYLQVGSVSANKISTSTLDALSVNTGSLTLSGVCSVGAAGGIYQGTGTFASPTTGLKIWNDSGIGRIAGYTNGVQRWYLYTSGQTACKFANQYGQTREDWPVDWSGGISTWDICCASVYYDALLARSNPQLKNNIQPVTARGLEKVRVLRPITFEWKDGGAATGLDLGSVPAELVQADADGNRIGYDLTGVVAYLAKAVQEIAERLDAAA